MDQYRRDPMMRGEPERPRYRRAVQDEQPEFRESLAAAPAAPVTQSVEPVATYRSAPAVAPAYRAAGVIYVLTLIVEALLSFRFLLHLLQASTTASFVRFIYAITRPFVAPFTGVIGLPIANGTARLEAVTLFAMLVWGVVGYLLMRLAQVLERRW